jgi:outer membrane protein TolC
VTRTVFSDAVGEQKKGAEDKGELPIVSTVPAATVEYPITLETALGLAGVENPTIALAQQAIRASEAEQLQARALLLPTLHAGLDFNVHRGNLESSLGIIRAVDRQSFYAGAGAAAVGAGTVTIPGVWLFSHLGDAYYEPLAARHLVAGRRFDALATENAVLLEVTTRYFALRGAEERLQAIQQSEQEFGELARLTANFVRAGQRRDGDAQRARAEAELLHSQEQRAEEDVAVASAELALLLNMDPAVRLRGNGEPLPLIQLVSPDEPLESLISIALSNRPEVTAREADVAVNRTRLRQEQVRPLLPILSVGFSAGTFGGGSNLTASRFGNFDGRTDFDVFAVWSLQNFGLGNLARQRERRALINESVAERTRAADQIRREVAEALAESAANLRQLDAARRQVETAAEGYRLDLDRAKDPRLGRVIEVLNSANLLAAARQDLIRATVAFNQAQFRLFVALGQPPTLANSREQLR